jgi:hypothetical protein
MIPVIPTYVTVLMIASEIAIAVAVLGVLSAAAGRSGLPPAARRRVRIGAVVFVGAWLGAALAWAPAPDANLARDAFYVPPLIPLFAGLSMAATFFLLRRSASLRRVMAAVPIAALHALQVWRILGIVFVVLFMGGRLPGHFALPAGWGDVAIGLTAPVVALILARGVRNAATIAVFWNVLGLLDLVVAVGMGTGLLAPLLLNEPGTRVPPAPAMGVFPLILVPIFAVPMSAMIHVIALGRLRGEYRLHAGMEPTAAR